MIQKVISDIKIKEKLDFKDFRFISDNGHNACYYAKHRQQDEPVEQIKPYSLRLKHIHTCK